MRHIGMGIGHQAGTAAPPIHVNIATEDNTISRPSEDSDEMSEDGDAMSEGELNVDGKDVVPQRNFEEEDTVDSDAQSYYYDSDSDQELPAYDTL